MSSEVTADSIRAALMADPVMRAGIEQVSEKIEREYRAQERKGQWRTRVRQQAATLKRLRRAVAR
jgi:hypothetical protein